MWVAVGAQGGKLITTKAKVSKVSSERVVPIFFSSHPDAHDAGTCSEMSSGSGGSGAAPKTQDACLADGGEWEPAPMLASLLALLAPGFLRVGGISADQVHYVGGGAADAMARRHAAAVSSEARVSAVRATSAPPGATAAAGWARPGSGCRRRSSAG